MNAENSRLKIYAVKFPYDEFFTRQNFRTVKLLYKEISHAKVSLLRNFFTAKLSSGKVSYGKLSFEENSYCEFSGRAALRKEY